MENELVSLLKDAPLILALLHSDLTKPSVKKVGTALETVFEFVTSPHLYLKLQNEKFRLNFERNVRNLKEKIDAIPDEELCTINPQIGVPIVEKLSYTTNEEIADLFTSLLAKAASTETVNQAHPAFIQIIERLSVDEARIINHLQKRGSHISFINVLTTTKQITTYLLKYLSGMEKEMDLLFPNEIQFYYENLLSAGIIENNHRSISNPSDYRYKKIREIYGIKEIESAYSRTSIEMTIEERVFETTDLGKKFIATCTEKVDK